MKSGSAVMTSRSGSCGPIIGVAHTLGAGDLFPALAGQRRVRSSWVVSRPGRLLLPPVPFARDPCAGCKPKARRGSFFTDATVRRRPGVPRPLSARLRWPVRSGSPFERQRSSSRLIVLKSIPGLYEIDPRTPILKWGERVSPGFATGQFGLKLGRPHRDDRHQHALRGFAYRGRT
jgi:hypothetical protein